MTTKPKAAGAAKAKPKPKAKAPAPKRGRGRPKGSADKGPRLMSEELEAAWAEAIPREALVEAIKADPLPWARMRQRREEKAAELAARKNALEGGADVVVVFGGADD